jgi:hypothetical protein
MIRLIPHEESYEVRFSDGRERPGTANGVGC